MLLVLNPLASIQKHIESVSTNRAVKPLLILSNILDVSVSVVIEFCLTKDSRIDCSRFIFLFVL